MHTKHTIAAAALLALCSVHAQAPKVEMEQAPPPPLPNSISGTETVDQRMKDFLRSQGFQGTGEQTLPDGRQVIVATGKGAIAVGPADRNFVQARINAFGKALLDAKMKCAELQQVNLAAELQSEYAAPGEQRAAEEARRLEREGLAKEGALKVAQALNADMKNAGKSQVLQTAGLYIEKILGNKVREELTKKGIDPNKPVSEQQVRQIADSASFKNIAKATAAERCTAIKVLASFEQNPASGQGSVGVVTVYTRKLHEIADAVVSGNYMLVPRGEPGIPIDQHIPSDLRTKLATFGTQLVRDERGEYVLLSFGQAQPTSNSQQGKDFAYRTARLHAQMQLRLFLGTEVYSHNMMAAAEQSTVFDDGQVEATFNSEKSSSIKAVAESLPIRGVAEVDSWETLHPANNAPVVGVVMAWKASSAQIAGALRDANAASRANAAATTANGLPQGGTQPARAGVPQELPRVSNPHSGQGVRSRDF
jgi:hypothetical protein